MFVYIDDLINGINCVSSLIFWIKFLKIFFCIHCSLILVIGYSFSWVIFMWQFLVNKYVITIDALKLIAKVVFAKLFNPHVESTRNWLFKTFSKPYLTLFFQTASIVMTLVVLQLLFLSSIVIVILVVVCTWFVQLIKVGLPWASTNAIDDIVIVSSSVYGLKTTKHCWKVTCAKHHCHLVIKKMFYIGWDSSNSS